MIFWYTDIQSKMTITSITFQWVGPVNNMKAEFTKIDKNGGGQILFSEFIEWALVKNLDLDDDIDCEE